MDINYELYKVFYHVAKTLSFSEAAKELFISQSAVSTSIKTLEKRLGQKLFTRSTKRVRLTAQGELLLRHVEPAVQLIERGQQQLLETDTLKAGQIRIGASDTICRYFLVPYLREFHYQYPGILIKITNGTSLECVDMLEDDQVDLIIVNSPNTKLNRIPCVQMLREFSDVFIANPQAVPLQGCSVSLAELRAWPILMLKKSTTSEFLTQLFLQHQLELVPSVELSSNDLLIDLARIGLGIAFVPDFCVAGRQDNLYIIRCKEELPRRKLMVAYSDHVPLSKAAQAFLKLLKSQISPSAAGL